MDRQESEISSLELTTEELDDVSGGMKNIFSSVRAR
jgi:hypothetical protein